MRSGSCRSARPAADSLFDTSVPPGAAVAVDVESTRPAAGVDPSGALVPAPDGTTFRWTGEARSVALVGSFNCWDPSADPLRRLADGTWTVTRALQPGFNDYYFLVDGTRWVRDPRNPNTRGDGFGGWMSTVPVK